MYACKSLETFDIMGQRPLATAQACPSCRLYPYCQGMVHKACFGMSLGVELSPVRAQAAARAVARRSSPMDGQLFAIKQLLVLREQIAPFEADFRCEAARAPHCPDTPGCAGAVMLWSHPFESAIGCGEPVIQPLK